MPPRIFALMALAIACAVLVSMCNGPARAEEMHASWYGKEHQGRRTASGERFNMHALTAAHRTLPFGTLLRVCRRGCVTVRISDRGPFVRGRGLDLSMAAARAIGCGGLCLVTVGR
jgi:rare lipoprotein A